MGKLTLGDLGLIQARPERACGCKNMYGGCGCVVRDFNNAVDLINKITVEEVVERAGVKDTIADLVAENKEMREEIKYLKTLTDFDPW